MAAGGGDGEEKLLFCGVVEPRGARRAGERTMTVYAICEIFFRLGTRGKKISPSRADVMYIRRTSGFMILYLMIYGVVVIRSPESVCARQLPRGKLRRTERTAFFTPHTTLFSK